MLHVKLRSESGAALVVAMVVTVVGSILAASYMTIVLNESRQSVRQKQKVQVLSIAEGGLERAIYYINNLDEAPLNWQASIHHDEHGQPSLAPKPVRYIGLDLDDPETSAIEFYTIELFDQADEPLLPARSILIRSRGVIRPRNSPRTEYAVTSIVSRLDEVPIPAALGIMDTADAEDEMYDFSSATWRISGRDHDPVTRLEIPGEGLPGVAVANAGDDIAGQIGAGRLDQITGYDPSVPPPDGPETEGATAIQADPTLPTNLDAYVSYFRQIAIDISASPVLTSFEAAGAEDDQQIYYCDLDRGDLKLSGSCEGFGVLVLEGTGTFEMTGGSEWNGVIICAGGADVTLKGGGGGTFINGALLVADGSVRMSGTADLFYNSAALANINAQLIMYQVYSWSGGWGESLGRHL